MAAIKYMTGRQSTHGLGNGDDWWNRGLCRGQDPALWESEGHLTDANRRALAMCRACPVRPLCRDDYLRARHRPRGIIAGGWRWDQGGDATPHPGEEHLAPAPCLPGPSMRVAREVGVSVRTIQRRRARDAA